jgi:hypothetical protein
MTSVVAGTDRKVRVLPDGGEVPRHLFLRSAKMKELSIFIDESGSFGEYELHSPYYIITLIFHDQEVDISGNILGFRNKMNTRYGMPEYTVHAGPLIRREDEYENFPIAERKMIFDSLFHFVRMTDITYHSVIVGKKNLIEAMDLEVQLIKHLSRFITGSIEMFMQYDRVVVYYDNGQMELTSVLNFVFNKLLNNIEFRKVEPANYKLFQAADMLCTLELLSLKVENKSISKSELEFFDSVRNLRRVYLKVINKKRFLKQKRFNPMTGRTFII